MRFLSVLCLSAAALAITGSAMPVAGQTFAAITGAEPVIGTPVTAPARVSVPGHRRHAEEKLLYGRVRDGVYTVDGMVAKVQLNYDVQGVRYLYLFAPGVGTAIVSVEADPDAVMTSASYKESELSFSVGEHHFDLSGVTLASDKAVAPAHLYVKLDRSAWHLNKRPMIGFGSVLTLPYVWPGALPAATATQADDAETAPPVPASLLPSATAVVPVPADAVASRPVAFR